MTNAKIATALVTVICFQWCLSAAFGQAISTATDTDVYHVIDPVVVIPGWVRVLATCPEKGSRLNNPPEVSQPTHLRPANVHFLTVGPTISQHDKIIDVQLKAQGTHKFQLKVHYNHPYRSVRSHFSWRPAVCLALPKALPGRSEILVDWIAFDTDGQQLKDRPIHHGQTSFSVIAE